MKFGKVIQRIGEQIPDKHFLRYKQLKKLLKHIKAAEGRGKEASDVCECSSPVSPKDEAAAPSASPGVLSAEETVFIKALNEELSNLNSDFMDAEEKVVIRLQALEAELNQMHKSDNKEDLQPLKAAFIDFHGEIVLLLHWGLLNYAAVTKILKKHDKQTHLPLRAPYLEAVLKQPFYSTDLLGRLAKRVAAIVEELVVEPDASPRSEGKTESFSGCGEAESTTMRDRFKMTQIALGTWQELGNNASTPSTVLPTRVESRVDKEAGEEQSASDTGNEVEEIDGVKPEGGKNELCGRKRRAVGVAEGDEATRRVCSEKKSSS
ncbi:hypothetical protein BSKO_01934 [Bryopsis sp. KO-2023]|nr:hypothetical protein BSKO_01934 [Bryopsis sp. KO-2023]